MRLAVDVEILVAAIGPDGGPAADGWGRGQVLDLQVLNLIEAAALQKVGSH